MRSEVFVEHVSRPPGILVMYNDCEGMIKGFPRDLAAERGVVDCAQAVAQALQARELCVEIAPITHDVESALAPFSPRDWLVFNLGEGLAGRLFEEVRIAWALEAMGYRFTGSDAVALALSTHKARAKLVLQKLGIATPAWRLFADASEVCAASLVGIDSPAVVKPVAEDASLGIDSGAVVDSLDSLRERVRFVIEHYRQAALVESFLPGREFNVSLWGDPPVVLPLAEVAFTAACSPSARIVSFSAKWEPGSPDYARTPVVCPAAVDPELRVQIHQIALKAWYAVGCRGYARVDLRLDRSGQPQVMEINCNPDLSPDAGFMRSARAAGMDYPQMVARIVELALRGTHGDDRSSQARRWRGHSATEWSDRGIQSSGCQLH